MRLPPDDPTARFPFADGEGGAALALARHDADEARGGPHLDLFLAEAAAADGDPDARAVRTWRLPLAAWNGSSFAAGAYDALAIAPHRAEYLRLPASRALPEGRGTVHPLLSAAAWARVAGAVEVRVAGQRIRLSPAGGDRWRAEFTADAGGRP
ncbi:MAG: hypothetical protein ACO3QC_02885 [Phycisphaerales bacterium]